MFFKTADGKAYGHNRTFVELKRSLRCQDAVLSFGHNRTFVELKPANSGKVLYQVLVIIALS